MSGGAWLPRPDGAPAWLRPWLVDHGSLTARLVARSSRFRVAVHRQARARPNRDEGALIGVSVPVRALARDVVLYCDDRPVVCAHSVVAYRHQHGPWRMVAGLGARPLGAALFADRTIARRALAFLRLPRWHPLYSMAAEVAGETPVELWARRSVFERDRAALLVTEVFLPALARL